MKRFRQPNAAAGKEFRIKLTDDEKDDKHSMSGSKRLQLGSAETAYTISL
jgi:hypothetical protein